jgi:hypothetical protein
MSNEPELDFGFLTQNQKPKPIFYLSLSSSVLGADPAEALPGLKEQGISSLDIDRIYGKEVMELTNEELKRLEKAMKAAGLSVARANGSLGMSLLSQSFEVDKQQLERALEVADWLGTSYIKTGSFIVPHGHNPAEYRDEVVQRLTEFAEMAQPWGIILLLENSPACYASSAEDCADLLKEISSSNLRFSFNLSNFLEVKEKPCRDSFAPVQNHLTFLNLDATLFESESSLETAEIPELLQAMWDNGYQGNLNLNATGEPLLKLKKLVSAVSGN